MRGTRQQQGPLWSGALLPLVVPLRGLEKRITLPLQRYVILDA